MVFHFRRIAVLFRVPIILTLKLLIFFILNLPSVLIKYLEYMEVFEKLPVSLHAMIRKLCKSNFKNKLANKLRILQN